MNGRRGREYGRSRLLYDRAERDGVFRGELVECKWTRSGRRLEGWFCSHGLRVTIRHSSELNLIILWIRHDVEACQK